MLTVEQVEGIGDLFFTVLTQCRHRGAIEGCNAGFVQFASHLLCSSQAGFYSVPAVLLDRVISQVRETSRAASSVTRRSAGLPLIVQSILASESKARQTVLLSCCITNLITVLQQPVPESLDDRIDLPHVHALNILKAVFREAGVANSVMPHVADASILAVEGFASPVWAVRNSAMQLFSTLVNRMLGQKKTKDDHLNTTTAAEFFTHYPALQPFVLREVRRAVDETQSGSFMLHPSLFPILSVLAKMGPGTATEDGTRLVSELQPCVLSLASCPILAVRDLAAHALVPLVMLHELAAFIVQLVHTLPSDRTTCNSYNWLHGTLLQIYRLVGALNRSSVEKTTRKDLANALLVKWWLSTSDNPCPLLRAHYLQIIEAVQTTRLASFNNLSELLDKELTSLGSPSSSTSVAVGEDKLSEVVVRLWLALHPTGLPRLLSNLHTQTLHMQISILEAMQEKLDARECTEWEMIATKLIDILLDTRDLKWKALCKMLSLLVNIHQRGLLSDCSHRHAELFTYLTEVVREEKNSTPAAFALYLSAVCLHKDSIHNWIKLLEVCSQPENGVLLHSYAAQALCVAGPHLHKSTCEEIAVCTFNCCVTLLVDEDSDTRNSAAVFVHALPVQGKHNYDVTHPNFALRTIFQYWSCTYRSPLFVQHLLGLFRGNNHDICAAIDAASSESVDDLFESQDVNPYREAVHLQHLAKTHIMTILEDPGSTDLCSERMYNELVSELESARHKLECVSGADTAVNCTSKPAVFSALHGMYSMAALYVWRAECKGSHAVHVSKLKQELTGHKAMVLHPGLAKLLQDI